MASFPPPRTLDELDRRIITLLRAEPRRSNTSLAGDLQVAEATVAARVRSLEADQVIRICAQRDFRAAGYEVLATVDLGVRGRAIADVAADVALIEGVGIITVVMGERPLMLLVMAPTLQALHEIIVNELAPIAGVASVETMIISEVVKYRSEFAALVQPSP